jgi:YbbR domain-containing protein
MKLRTFGRAVVRHFWWKLASLALAVLLWVALLGEPELVAIQTVPVLYRNLSSSLLLLSDTPANVQVELRGPSRKLTHDALAEVAVTLDLSGVKTPGERTFTLSRTELPVPEGVAFLRAVPSQLRLRFDRGMTKDVPVEVRLTGTPAAGFRIAGHSASPDRLRVSGPESRVQPIQRAETDPVDISGLTGSSVTQVNTFVADPRVQFESPSVVTVNVVVEPSTSKQP